MSQKLFVLERIIFFMLDKVLFIFICLNQIL